MKDKILWVTCIGLLIVSVSLNIQLTYTLGSTLAKKDKVQMQLERRDKIIEMLRKDLAKKPKVLTRVIQVVASEKAPWKITKAQATAYSPFDNRDGTQASRGRAPRTSRGLIPGPHIMAVDPKRIPYGSRLMLIYPDGTKVEGIAGDTGGALRSAKRVVIDVFKYTYREARAHSRKEIILLWKPKK